MSAINTLVRSTGRISSSCAAATARRSIVQGQQQIQRRCYADSSGRPPLAHGGHNRTLIFGIVGVTVPALAWFALRDDAEQATKVAAPLLDPGLKTREKREAEPSAPKYKHAEDDDPELKAPFGQVHKRKRVDGPPDERNHQSLSDRNRLG
ncbi:hypothetical protein F5X99DRAFT_399905 [Biscogniauxia marginata]|nr:hypothetical protein F5X99DRAFT_399905 [Biscogniauxia marginata]